MTQTVAPTISIKSKISVLSNMLIGVVIIAFLTFYLTLSYFNRPASDDILFISILKNKSLFEYVNWFYATWSGRFASNTYFYLITMPAKQFQNIHHSIFIYHLLTLLILIYSINSILKKLCKKLYNFAPNNFTSLTFSILFISSFYFFTFNHIEVWWWVCASVDSLQGIVFLLLGVSVLLNENKKAIHYLLLVFCFLYVGGGYEIYAFILAALFLLFFLFSFIWKQKLTSLLNIKKYSKGILVAFVSLVVALSISVSAGGNQLRKQKVIENNLQMHKSAEQNFNTEIKNYSFFQPKLFVAIGISALFLILGSKIKTGINANADIRKLKFCFRIIILSLFISILIPILFQFLILDGGEIPLRGYTFTSFLLAIIFCFLCLNFGFYFQIKSSFLNHSVNIVIPLLIAIAMVQLTIKQFNFVSVYADKYDQIFSTLIESQKQNNVKDVYIESLPDSGMLVPTDFLDSSITEPVKSILDLKFNIKIKK